MFTKAGKIYGGTNIESVSYGGTLCAERVAMWKLVSESERDFVAMAVIGSGRIEGYSCAICRQMLLEFGLNLRELVPFPFVRDALLGRWTRAVNQAE